MTKCYKVKSKHTNLQGDGYLKADGIQVRVNVTMEQWKEISLEDLVSCRIKNGQFYVNKIFKVS